MTNESSSVGGRLIDLSGAVVLSPAGLGKRQNNAIGMLLDEVEKRSGIRWERSPQWPTEETPLICVLLASDRSTFTANFVRTLPPIAYSESPEGYQIYCPKDGDNNHIFVSGNDERGVLFGIGRLLRELRMGPGKIHLPKDFEEISAPSYSLRGQQLG